MVEIETINNLPQIVLQHVWGLQPVAQMDRAVSTQGQDTGSIPVRLFIDFGASLTTVAAFTSSYRGFDPL